jgi:hypothetical protein
MRASVRESSLLLFDVNDPRSRSSRRRFSAIGMAGPELPIFPDRDARPLELTVFHPMRLVTHRSVNLVCRRPGNGEPVGAGRFRRMERKGIHVMTRFKRLIAATIATAAATVIPVTIAAAPAHADTEACADFLADNGVDITDAIVNACGVGEEGDGDACVRGLLDASLPPGLPPVACALANG